MQKIQKYSLNRSKKEKILGGGRGYTTLTLLRSLNTEVLFTLPERHFH